MLVGLLYVLQADAAILGQPGTAEIFSSFAGQASLAAAPTETILLAAAPVAESLVARPVEPLAASQAITATTMVTPSVNGTVYLPLVFRPEPPPPPPPPEPRSLLACTDPNRALPDNDWVTDYMTVNTGGQVVSLDVYAQVNHSWVGDVTLRLEHDGKIVKLFDRPGVPDPADDSRGCDQNNIRAVFGDDFELYAEHKCLGLGTAIGGSFLPVTSLDNTFFNTPAGGSWGLRVVDEGAGDTGTLVRWCLDLTVVDGEPTPPEPTEPPSLPDNAYVGGMTGAYQVYNLDCESRSAVDWARHWGYNIGETDFFWGLPNTDNPETGFVGNVQGTWGYVPPSDYGVHAEPIAERLRDYGLNAEARKYMSWDDARAEIAAGRPVIVWIIGIVQDWAYTISPRYYAPGGGPYTVTAPYEHTMVLVGYDENTVWLLNGSDILTRPLESFLLSWSALSNQGVVFVP